ncbi:NADH-quinone oxidoreductase subunit H [Caminibacter mediatlanticus TB-2]|uniref:Ech Hydrogenase, Subunit n=1 Tax=Caminibacter mediatlanticus TB-2 TaxID=391592 RepID=A0AAI9AIB9_9BACT|nr:complex I subunit 1 family protein [Caminibacter mediatlanticus]EDM24037.1 Ech Hydrogenase, Subunit [Caminibacter mediatlanticus TB-2]QCT94398.1 NADH-quinone oxidoreductase subunit H [Caminibacter mediatlanticus TB-2]
MIEWIFVLLAPIIGGLIYGVERIVRARMQSRLGPPLMQPFYDFFKLMDKRPMMVHSMHALMGIMYFIAEWFAFAVLIFGNDILLAIFFHVIAVLALVIGASSVRSAYSVMGAIRELMHMISYEPIMVLLVIGLFLVSGSFDYRDILNYEGYPILELPIVFIVFLLTIPMMLQKSPFDVAEAHQEIIGGPEIEYSGPFYEAVYTAKWIEYVYVFFFAFLFGGSHYWLGAILAVFAFIFVNLLDNSTARVDFRRMVKFAWFVLIPLAAANIMLIAMWR